jgi:hypothetical protein
MAGVTRCIDPAEPEGTPSLPALKPPRAILCGWYIPNSEQQAHAFEITLPVRENCTPVAWVALAPVLNAIASVLHR